MCLVIASDLASRHRVEARNNEGRGALSIGVQILVCLLEHNYNVDY